MKFFAWYIVGGNPLSTGRINLWRRDNSSSKNLFEQPWIVDMFNKVSVVDNLEHLVVQSSFFPSWVEFYIMKIGATTLDFMSL
jgi:hypothetical protein